MKPIFTPAEMLLPIGQDYTKWSVIACDQFSSEREYWDRVTSFVGQAPSTLKMVVPEAYLSSVSMQDASASRNETMNRYLKEGILKPIEPSYIYVERTVTGGKIRRGLIGKLDLEAYDYLPGSLVPARASERTVIERLPPRIQVRREAAIEMPHVLVLIDDEKKRAIEPLTDQKENLTVLYDFDLMEDGGHITGYQVCGDKADRVTQAIAALGERAVSFVIGDGNHSLAAAKDCWRAIKASLPEAEWEDHPARFALVELCNVYDEGIEFEPIHRIAFHADPEALLSRLAKEAGDENGRELFYLYDGKEGSIRIRNESLGAFIGAIQTVLDAYAEETGAVIDYIHDDASLRKLAEAERSLALFMPLMDKGDLFCTVEKSGVFPKKSFSIGHARDKRYYTECRKITK